MKKATTPLLTLGLGAALGSLAGILFAPRKGTITRARIKSKMDEAKEKADEKTQQIKNRAVRARNKAADDLSVPTEE